MKCDIGRLRGYLDNALSSVERAAIEEHLAGCTSCQAELTTLQQRSADVALRLSALDPQPHESSSAAWALARFHTQTCITPKGLEKPLRAIVAQWSTTKRRVAMMRQTLFSGRQRLAAIGVVALICLTILLSFASVRQATAQFLGIFRVRTFAVIPIDPAQVERLRSLEDLMEAGTLGEPTILREAGEPQAVADAAEAANLAGFNVRVPAALPEGMTLAEFTVEAGPAVRFEADRATMQAVLEAAEASDVVLPPIDTIVVEADFPNMVHQAYRADHFKLDIVQMPSPIVTLPPDVDLVVLGEALLRVLGVPPEDSRRLAQAIDWTSTMVIPLPTDVGRFREVDVDGVTGVFLEITHNPKRDAEIEDDQPGGMVMWQRDGIVYAVEGRGIDPIELLRVADSLR